MFIAQNHAACNSAGREIVNISQLVGNIVPTNWYYQLLCLCEESDTAATAILSKLVFLYHYNSVLFCFEELALQNCKKFVCSRTNCTPCLLTPCVTFQFFKSFEYNSERQLNFDYFKWKSISNKSNFFGKEKFNAQLSSESPVSIQSCTQSVALVLIEIIDTQLIDDSNILQSWAGFNRVPSIMLQARAGHEFYKIKLIKNKNNQG